MSETAMNLQAVVKRRWNRELWVPVLVVTGVLLFRLAVLSSFLASPFSRPSGGDIGFYHQWAQRILGGELTDGRAFYALPLYAYWLAGLYAIFGINGFIPGLLQSLADAGTALIIYKLAVAGFSGSQGTRKVGAASLPAGPFLSRGQITGIIGALAWAF